MRILLDECTPSIVKKRLTHRQIETVQELGWAGVKNGDLLRAAKGVFDVFVTTDKNYSPSTESRRMRISDCALANQSGSHCRSADTCD